MNPIDYHEHPALGSTDIRNLLRSPMHFWASRSASRVETPAMRRGTLAHVCVLEPERWDREYVIAPKFNLRTNDGKAARADFEASNAGRVVITHEEAGLAESIRAAVMAHPAAAGLIRAKGGVEVPVFWEDEMTGIACKGRVDLVAKVSGRDILCDLKTTPDASASGFAKAIANWSLHCQAAHYIDGWRTITGEAPAAYVLIAVEADAPHAVATYALDAAALEKGAALRLRALDRYAECIAADEWPGYAAEIVNISIPAWAESE